MSEQMERRATRHAIAAIGTRTERAGTANPEILEVVMEEQMKKESEAA
jgi:hypothetical protein